MSIPMADPRSVMSSDFQVRRSAGFAFDSSREPKYKNTIKPLNRKGIHNKVDIGQATAEPKK